jgi:membrane-bound lytic murein transglycosylase D
MCRGSGRTRAVAASGILLGLLLAGCASAPSTPPTATSPPPDSTPPPPPAARVLPALPADSLSAEEARDLAAIEAETFHGPVGSSNADMDEELEEFFGEESDALLSEKVSYDIPIVINDRVHYFIDYFQNRVDKSFSKWLARSPQYVPYLKARFRQAGLPEDLLYISLIESGFSPQATSRANAVGYWQFIAGTARRYGLRVDRWVDERRDFEKSTEAAIAYLKDLHRMFGSWYLAAAAYNSGEGRIQNAIERYGSEDLWELSEFSYLREETKNYVPKLIAAILIAKEPEKYGFTGILPLPPVEVDVVTVPTQTDLAVIAASAGTTLETIRALNPLLRSHSTPPGVADYEVRVPAGASALFAERFARVPVGERIVIRTHVVRRGETLSRIAERYGVATRELIAENGIRNPRRLRAGQRLRIPRPARGWEAEAPPVQVAGAAASSETPAAPAEPAGAAAAQASPSGGATEPAETVVAEVTPPEAPAGEAGGAPKPIEVASAPVPVPPTGGEPGAEPVRPQTPAVAGAGNAERGPAEAEPPAARVTRTTRYRVKPGETLYRIARKHGVTVAEMERWNPQASSRIHPGMVLILRPSPSRRDPAPEPSLASTPGAARRDASGRTLHRVRSGDTLWSIARRYEVTLAQLREWNGIRDDRIHAGDRLVLFPEGTDAGR